MFDPPRDNAGCQKIVAGPDRSNPTPFVTSPTGLVAGLCFQADRKLVEPAILNTQTVSRSDAIPISLTQRPYIGAPPPGNGAGGAPRIGAPPPGGGTPRMGTPPPGGCSRVRPLPLARAGCIGAPPGLSHETAEASGGSSRSGCC